MQTFDNSFLVRIVLCFNPDLNNVSGTNLNLIGPLLPQVGGRVPYIGGLPVGAPKAGVRLIGWPERGVKSQPVVDSRWSLNVCGQPELSTRRSFKLAVSNVGLEGAVPHLGIFRAPEFSP